MVGDRSNLGRHAQHVEKMMTPPVAMDLVQRCAERARSCVEIEAFYIAGSLATGDYVTGRSDFDLVAITAQRLTADQAQALTREHLALIRKDTLADKLHCVYVPAHDVNATSMEHPTWAHQELYKRPLSAIARAELLRFGITVFGPKPADVLPPVTPADLKQAVRDELTGYWADALGKPHLWTQDIYVDLGLLVLARAEATLANGELITKHSAIATLPALGVPAELTCQVLARRYGIPPLLDEASRQQRAVLVRAILSAGIRRLTGDTASPG